MSALKTEKMIKDEINDFKNFALIFYNIKSRIKIIYLSKEDWDEYIFENFQIDKLPEMIGSHLKKSNNWDLLNEAIDNIKNADEGIKKEYGEEIDFKDFIGIANIRSVNGLKGFRKFINKLKNEGICFNNNFTLTMKSLDENIDYEWLIIVNEYLFNKKDDKQKLRIIAHEIVHISDLRIDRQRKFEYIENEARDLVNIYLKVSN